MVRTFPIGQQPWTLAVMVPSMYFVNENEKLQQICLSLDQLVFRLLEECQQAVQEGREEGGCTRGQVGGYVPAQR